MFFFGWLVGWLVFVFKFQMLLLGICKEMNEFSVVIFRLMTLKSYHRGQVEREFSPTYMYETNTTQATAHIVIMC